MMYPIRLLCAEFYKYSTSYSTTSASKDKYLFTGHLFATKGFILDLIDGVGDAQRLKIPVNVTSNWSSAKVSVSLCTP